MIELMLLALMCQCDMCVCEDPGPGPTPPPIEEACDGPQGFSGGTIWKPESDSDGKLVILLAAQYEFDTCSVRLKDGSFEEMEYRGRSNGDRQTWRASQPGSFYASKKKQGGVRCFLLENDEPIGQCDWPIPGKAGVRHD